MITILLHILTSFSTSIKLLAWVKKSPSIFICSRFTHRVLYATSPLNRSAIRIPYRAHLRLLFTWATVQHNIHSDRIIHYNTSHLGCILCWYFDHPNNLGCAIWNQKHPDKVRKSEEQEKKTFHSKEKNEIKINSKKRIRSTEKQEYWNKNKKTSLEPKSNI